MLYTKIYAINCLHDLRNVLSLLSPGDKLGSHGLIYCFAQYSLRGKIRRY